MPPCRRCVGKSSVDKMYTMYVGYKSKMRRIVFGKLQDKNILFLVLILVLETCSTDPYWWGGVIVLPVCSELTKS